MAKISRAMVAKKKLGDGNPINKKKSEADQAVEIRDILNYFVGAGTTDFRGDENAKNNMSVLAGLVGREKANKLAMSAYLFNRRPGISNMSPEQKIASFYGMGSSDPDVNTTLQNLRSMGTGPVAAYYNTPNIDVQNLQR